MNSKDDNNDGNSMTYWANMASNSDDTGLFEENIERKLIKAREKAHIAQERLKKYSKPEINRANHLVENEMKQIKIRWPGLFGKSEIYYAHYDLDMFYASVELLYDVSLRTVPFAVGSDLMLATCNYEARKYGVKAGMPGYMAKKLCPGLRIVSLHFDRYRAYSKKVMEILCYYDSEFQIMGIDEGVMKFDDSKYRKAVNLYNNSHKYGILNVRDLKVIRNGNMCSSITNIVNNTTSSGRDMDNQKGDAQEFELFWDSNKVENLEKLFKNIDKDGKLDENLEFNQNNLSFLLDLIRHVVYRNTRLTVSAGISVTKGLAKFASNLNKPNGICPLEGKFEVLDELKLEKINGIGKYTKELIEKSLNITRIGEFRSAMNIIFLIFKPKTAIKLLRHSYGLSIHDSLTTNIVEKSKSVSLSFVPTTSHNTLCDVMWELCVSLFTRLEKVRNIGSLLTVRLKFENFKSVSKQKAISKMIYKIEELFELAIETVKDIRNEIGSIKVRMLAVAIGRLQKKNNLDIFKPTANYIPEPYFEKNCCMCGINFDSVPTSIFISHVELCIKKSETKKKDKGILGFIKPRNSF